VQVGGHNPVEPALCGVPMIMGEAVFNFDDVVAPFRDADCLRLVEGVDGLTQVLAAWLADPDTRRTMGDRARAVVAANTGARARLRGLLEQEIGRTAPDAAVPARAR
jgi:3-deoxy-D-manno-octulosonic-acid transferase